MTAVDYGSKVPVPSHDEINTGASPIHTSTIHAIFGTLPNLTADCSDGWQNVDRLKGKIKTEDVGPFRLTGHVEFLRSVREVLAEVKATHPDLYAAIGTAGCLCYRHVRGFPGSPSNHACGLAVDLTFGGVLDDLGSSRCTRGSLAVYGIAHRHKIFWGAGFARSDAMHWEASDELIRLWFAQGKL